MASKYPATNFSDAVELAEIASNQLHQIVNGDSTTEIVIEDGSRIPSVQKALTDNFYFKPPIRWAAGLKAISFNQLYLFTDSLFYYSPFATPNSPITLGETPVGDGAFYVAPIGSSYNGSQVDRTISTEAPSGVPVDGEEWIVIPSGA